MNGQWVRDCSTNADRPDIRNQNLSAMSGRTVQGCGPFRIDCSEYGIFAPDRLVIPCFKMLVQRRRTLQPLRSTLWPENDRDGHPRI
jgi:hypothetical protein